MTQGSNQVLMVTGRGASRGNINLSIKTIIKYFKIVLQILTLPKCFEKLFINISIILESFPIF